MARVALVLSLSHSGSTLLDLILAGNPRCVGLGEIHNVLETPASRLEEKFGGACTCGRSADTCEFWGPFKSWLGENFDRSPQEKYTAMLRHFDEVFGTDMILIDSSKKLRVANLYHSMPNVDLKVLHLRKDVRAYTVSQIDNNPANGRTTLRALAAFRTWYRKNKKIESLVQEKQIPHIRLGYDELCLHPDETVERLCGFLGVAYTADMLELDGRNSHMIAGNPMRHDPEKRRQIVHDDRWQQRNDWSLAALVSPGIMRYNAREVRKS